MQAPVLNVDNKTAFNQGSNSSFNSYQRNNQPNPANIPVYDEDHNNVNLNQGYEAYRDNSSVSNANSNANSSLNSNFSSDVNPNPNGERQTNQRNALLVKGGENIRLNEVNGLNQVKEVRESNQINYEVRSIYVEIQRSRLNRLRSYLERLKKPFEADPYNLRIADAPIIDAMIGCAVVSSKTLKEYLDKAYSTPAYLPPEDEVFQLTAQEEPKTQEQKRREREERNLNRNLRVELSSASSERILNLQMELTQLMGWQPDINALGNALLDLSQHKSRRIVESIADHYKNASKKEENKQEVTAL